MPTLEAQRADNGGSAGDSLKESERAIAAALAIDPNEPHAHLARLLLRSGTLDLGTTEDRLRQILAADPSNIQAMRLLWNMLQCVGRSREALALVERSLRINPLASGAIIRERNYYG